MTNYLPFGLFPVLYVGARLYHKCRPVHVLDMDFVSDLKEIEESVYEDPPNQSRVERFWAWLVSIQILIHFKSASHRQ